MLNRELRSGSPEEGPQDRYGEQGSILQEPPEVPGKGSLVEDCNSSGSTRRRAQTIVMQLQMEDGESQDIWDTMNSTVLTINPVSRTRKTMVNKIDMVLDLTDTTTMYKSEVDSNRDHSL